MLARALQLFCSGDINISTFSQNTLNARKGITTQLRGKSILMFRQVRIHLMLARALQPVAFMADMLFQITGQNTLNARKGITTLPLRPRTIPTP